MTTAASPMLRSSAHRRMPGTADACLSWRLLLDDLFDAQTNEQVAILGFDERDRLRARMVATGARDAVALPASYFRTLCATPSVHGVAIAHSHPSGIARPSARDVRATQDIARALAFAGMTLIDHLVWTPRELFSFVEAGLL